jgi:hypothetical protein
MFLVSISPNERRKVGFELDALILNNILRPMVEAPFEGAS